MLAVVVAQANNIKSKDIIQSTYIHEGCTDTLYVLRTAVSDS